MLRLHLRVDGDRWHTTGGMAPEASGWLRRPLLITHRGERGAQGNGLERPGSPKRSLWINPRGAGVSNNGGNGLEPPGSPIRSLCGSSMGRGIPHNGENGPGTARIANPSLCGTAIGGRMPHNEGNEVAERLSRPNHLMRNQLRHWADRVASRWRTVGTRGAAGLGREEGRGSVQDMASRRRTVGTSRHEGGQAGSGQSGGRPPCGRPATLRTLDDSEPDRVKSPNGRARDCGVLVTLSRNASNRQTAGRNSVKTGQH